MNKIKEHLKKIEQLQDVIENFRNQGPSSSSLPIALQYSSSHSNTTRTKTYKSKCPSLNLENFNEVIQIDFEKKFAIVEPRVTMEMLLKATLPYGLIPPVLPEFKGITVGGAIMGGAGESSSHHWGCFHDICHSYEILCGDGNLLEVSSQENSDLYYGIAGSYGSLGLLVSAKIQLIPAQDYIYLCHHFFSNPLEAIEMMRNRFHSSQKPDFIDGIVFSKDLCVVTEGSLQPKNYSSQDVPLFSLNSPLSPWFYQHVKSLAIEMTDKSYVEKMTLEDYFFRYDLGAFWMGAYLFHIPFLTNFISQGILGFKNLDNKDEGFTEKEIQRFHCIPAPHALGRILLRPLFKSKNLWTLLHKAENWVANRIIIQDFCIPETKAFNFCKDVLNNPAVFPLWICPIKGTRTPQIFAPHFLANQDESHFINFGIYGIPSCPGLIQSITNELEQNTYASGGRKVLYSHSYYTEEQFWQIYPRGSYENLRCHTKAHGIWHDITDKVLSK